MAIRQTRIEDEDEDPVRASRVQSLDRALDILEELGSAGGEISLSELSEHVGLHVSTVHRLLSVLVRRGYARQRGPSGRYALGPQVLTLSSSAVGAGQFDLRSDARPVLRELTQRSGETSNLVGMFDDSVVYLEQVASRHMVRMFTQVGTRAPAYCTAAGKAMLAFRPIPELEAYLARTPFEQHTPHTLASAAALRDALDAVRATGYALDEGEMEEGVRCVAAPILDSAGHPQASLSISGPAARFTGERVRQTVPALLDAARELSARLGWRFPSASGS